MFLLALLLFLLGLVLLWLATRRRKASGLPGGRIIYTDTRGWGIVEKPLYDQELGLTGKPDYLVEQGDQIIPVEVKSGRAPEGPYDSHIFQLAAYCYLVQKVYKKRPAYGILKYSNRTFAIDYTPELEKSLQQILAEMHSNEAATDVTRSHNSPGRCQGCGFRDICNQNLTRGVSASG